jgi:pimeloyl-ACP methyl ester carboxylesterase
MPKVHVNGLDHYYEQTGEGTPLVFVHGAFGDSRLWEPQWTYFSTKYRLLRYDLRGHGKTGVSAMAHYSIQTFADDLASLLDALEIRSPVICGLSWGGSIAQAFAVRSPERPQALIMAGSSVAIDLTLVDKLLCNVLFPKWAMLLAIRSLSVDKFVRFSLWLGRVTQGKHWLSRDESFSRYLAECMLQVESREYLKLWEAMYGFHLLPLERITCPTLVLNGDHESKGTLRHAQEILRRVPHAEARMIPAAYHASNIENPDAFNRFVEDFIPRI